MLELNRAFAQETSGKSPLHHQIMARSPSVLFVHIDQQRK